MGGAWDPRDLVEAIPFIVPSTTCRHKIGTQDISSFKTHKVKLGTDKSGSYSPTLTPLRPVVCVCATGASGITDFNSEGLPLASPCTCPTRTARGS
jgi:hypothetical protein